MSNSRPKLVLTAVALVVIVALATVWVSRARADEDDEPPITSSAAKVTRDAAGHVLITIKPQARKEIGLATETLKRVTRSLAVPAYGYVLDPAPLAVLNSRLLSVNAALDASAAQYHRSRRLYAERRNVSLHDLQIARAAYLSDQARARALEQQLRDAWGSEIAQMNPAARRRFINALITRHQAIAHVTAPVGEHFDDIPRTAVVRVLGHERHPLHARAVYPAPAADRAIQGRSYLLIIDAGEFSMLPGDAISASMPVSNNAVAGVIIPRSAVVRYAGKDWVYRALTGGSFVRSDISSARPTRTGYFVSAGLAPGMRIVVTGAQTLLSQELKARIQMED